ncbi:hypothetical protein PG987_001212 [Apiospora arundinis]
MFVTVADTMATSQPSTEPTAKKVQASKADSPPPQELRGPPTITDEPSPSAPPTSITYPDFESAKVHPLPKSADLNIESYVGQGVEGIVFEGTINTDTLVAVKIFWRTLHPVTIRKSGSKRLEEWPFKEECRNVAILQTMQQCMDIAAEKGRSIQVKAKLETEEDVKRNIQAFCSQPSPPESTSESTNTGDEYVTITDLLSLPRCYGWTTIKRESLEKLPDFHMDEYVDPDVDFHYALVYDYKPKRKTLDASMQDHLDFFYYAGFTLRPYREENWRAGTLVDMNDVASPFGPWWEWDEFRHQTVSEYTDDSYM